jgi:hypothetical protein
MPLALLARRAGITLPVGQLVQTLHDAYTDAVSRTDADAR